MMKHWVLIFSLVLTRLFIASNTYRAGLKQYGVAIAILGSSAWLLIGLGYWMGWPLFVIDAALFLYSRQIMKRYGIGPYGQ